MVCETGFIRIYYSGRLPRALAEHMAATGLTASASRPLVIESPAPAQVLNELSPYLRDPVMMVERIRLRPPGPGTGLSRTRPVLRIPAG